MIEAAAELLLCACWEDDSCTKCSSSSPGLRISKFLKMEIINENACFKSLILKYANVFIDDSSILECISSRLFISLFKGRSILSTYCEESSL